MSRITPEQDWKTAARAFFKERDPGEKSTQALLFVDGFKQVPEARKWLAAYFNNPQPEALTHPCLAFLLPAFYQNPTPQELAIATHFWEQANNETIEITSQIILAGRELLTSPQKSDYAAKAAMFFKDMRGDRTGHYNYGADLIEVAGEFDLPAHGGWITGVLKYDAAYPRAGAAYRYGVKYSPEETARALMVNLSEAPGNYFTRRAWVAQHMVPHAEYLPTAGLDLLARNLVLLNAYLPARGNPDTGWAYSMAHGALLEYPEKITHIADALPTNHPALWLLGAYAN